jgi:exosortase F-associated protein
MHQKKQNKTLRILALVALLFAIILVRVFENQLFNDPLLEFFKKDFSSSSLPDVSNYAYFLGLFFRYAVNTVLSLGIIYFVFNEFELVTLSLVLYVLFFVVLIIGFFTVANISYENQKWHLFYIRRFIIQPIFLLLFVAGFYYQKRK